VTETAKGRTWHHCAALHGCRLPSGCGSL